jgi:DNA/RNA endonuclease YhcR with UshA esterase domain
VLALLLALMPVLGYAAPENPPTIPPADAAQHVGELVIVQGVVDQVSVSSRSSTTYLNFGSRYPNHTFAAVIFQAKQSQFPNVQAYEGKKVEVRGVVQLYRGKPEIILNERGQLRVPE